MFRCSHSIINIIVTETFDRSRPDADGLLEPIARACHIFAQAVSCIRLAMDSGTSVHAAETIYLMIIFFLRSIPLLYTHISSEKNLKTQQFISMVLSALNNWLDCSLMILINDTERICNPDNKLLQCRIALCGLLQTCVIFSGLYLLTKQTLTQIQNLSNRYPFVRMILPKSFTLIVLYPVIDPYLCPVFPRRIFSRNVSRCWCHSSRYYKLNPPEIQALIDQSTSRSIRLLASYTELEREARDRAIKRAHILLEKGGRCADFEMEFDFRMRLNQTKCAYDKALKMWASVSKDNLTKEFCQTRAYNGFFLQYRYKSRCFWRSKWAQFFLCNFNWDWDLAGSLERLYTLDETSPTPRTHSQQPETHIATIDSEGAVGQTWDMKARATQLVHKDLPNELRIPYASDTGETRFMVFSRKAEMPRVLAEVPTTLSGYDDNSGDRGSIATAEIDERSGRKVSSGIQRFVGEIAGEGDGNTTALETSSESVSILDLQECDVKSWMAQDIDACPVIPSTDEALECEAYIYNRPY